MNIIDVTHKNVEETSFFCKMSQKKSAGYQKKLNWLKKRFAEGMHIKLLDISQNGRGFVEYIPGEYTWRAVNAKAYMMIHCLWVVGKSKGKGYGTMLLNECLADAKKMGMSGIAMVSSEEAGLVGRKFLLHHGFESVDKAKPSFELMVKRFGKTEAPCFPNDWEERAQTFGTGLTVISSGQCPYNAATEELALELGKEQGLECRIAELKSSEDVQRSSPSPYGVFSIVLNGKLICNQHVIRKKLLKLIMQRVFEK